MACLKVITFCAFAVCFVNGRMLIPFFRNPYLSAQREEVPQESEQTNSPEILTKEYEGQATYNSPREQEMMYIVSEEKLPWNEAKLACESQGMRLACPEDDNQKSHIQQFIISNGLTPIDKFSGYWLGASQTSDSAPYIWESSKKPVSYSGWIPGEPNYYSGENCVELKNDMGRVGFNNIYCDQPKRYICETSAGSESFKNEKTPYFNPQYDESYKMIRQKLIDMLIESQNEASESTADDDITTDNKLPQITVDQTVESHTDDITADDKLPQINMDQTVESHTGDITADYKLLDKNIDTVELVSDGITADFKLPQKYLDQTAETVSDGITDQTVEPLSDDITAEFKLPPMIIDETNPFVEIPTRDSTDEFVQWRSTQDDISPEIYPVVTHGLSQSEEEESYVDNYDVYSDVY